MISAATADWCLTDEEGERCDFKPVDWDVKDCIRAYPETYNGCMVVNQTRATNEEMLNTFDDSNLSRQQPVRLLKQQTFEDGTFRCANRHEMICRAQLHSLHKWCPIRLSSLVWVKINLNQLGCN